MIRLGAALFLALLASALACGAGQFDVSLRLDTESAERSIELFRGRSGSPSVIAGLRGSRIALATTALLSGQRLTQQDLEDALQAVKFNQLPEDDVFRMSEGRRAVNDLQELLDAVRQRNFAGRVVGTVAQLFPEEARISTTIPLYFVAFGHENIDAFVRRVKWQGDMPVFVGEGEGELTIVVNLSKAVTYGRVLDERFIGLLSVVAHEVFHAAFGVYKDTSPVWSEYYRTHTGFLDRLLDLTQNEGIAHYLSFIQRTGGKFRSNELPKVDAAFEEFNRVAALLARGQVSPPRAAELIRQSNSSGYWESYGAITGMVIARQIDQSMGRRALMETMALGPDDFYEKYASLMQRESGLPSLSEELVRRFGR